MEHTTDELVQFRVAESHEESNTVASRRDDRSIAATQTEPGSADPTQATLVVLQRRKHRQTRQNRVLESASMKAAKLVASESMEEYGLVTSIPRQLLPAILWNKETNQEKALQSPRSSRGRRRQGGR
jgi:hypothetical protein